MWLESQLVRRVARAGLVAGGIAFSATIAARPVSAAEPPCPVDRMVANPAPHLSTESPAARLRFIRLQMDTGARRAVAWSTGWGVAYGVAAVTQLAVTPFVSSGTRTDLYVGAASAGLGVITRAVSRPAVIRERRRLNRRVNAEGTTCATVQAAEAALARSARWERRNRRLFIHLAALAYNTSVGLVLGLALDRPLSGIRQATIGAVVGQVMFVTQPMTSVRALDRYRGGEIHSTHARIHTAPWIVPGGGGGVRVLGRF